MSLFVNVGFLCCDNGMRVCQSERAAAPWLPILHVRRDSCASEHGPRILGSFVEFLVTVPVSLLAVLVAVEGLLAGLAGGRGLASILLGLSAGPAAGTKSKLAQAGWFDVQIVCAEDQ